MTFLIVITVALACVILCSVIEGLFHQYILHTPQQKLFGGALYLSYHYHAVEHHPAYRAEHYHRPAPDTEAPISLGPLMWPALMLFTSPITVGVWYFLGWKAGITVPIVFTLYYISYEFLHWHMHFPKKDGSPRWYHAFPPSSQLFKWFDKRHYIHHIADDRNYNVVWPIYDLLFGHYTTDEKVVPWAVRRRKARALRKSQEIRKQLEKKVS
ncbi:MAG: hypothetical protein JSS66_01755 [Armatimonadetes bacterium]|nr:hypothetical protein [Armatimonadota bacterium]